ncbi:hypothetical protein AVEN_222038-1 [Araneus ventricosus]|uniref:Uncharacterized protein n=1 Tax=Araneus ventricosus TaxID=182803 RepID=A0A4Y2JR14_ARAVE|nr:hypothetical protein AVEN_222038-1 [Araneus ventricosus]
MVMSRVCVNIKYFSKDYAQFSFDKVSKLLSENIKITHPPAGVMWKFEKEGYRVKCIPCQLIMGQNYEVHPKVPLGPRWLSGKISAWGSRRLQVRNSIPLKIPRVRGSVAH